MTFLGSRQTFCVTKNKPRRSGACGSADTCHAVARSGRRLKGHHQRSAGFPLSSIRIGRKTAVNVRSLQNCCDLGLLGTDCSTRCRPSRAVVGHRRWLFRPCRYPDSLRLLESFQGDLTSRLELELLANRKLTDAVGHDYFPGSPEIPAPRGSNLTTRKYLASSR